KVQFAHLRGVQNCPTPSSHVIQLNGAIFELNSRIKETNVLSKFHENWAKNVTSTVLTCFHYIHIQKNAPPTGQGLTLTFFSTSPFGLVNAEPTSPDQSFMCPDQSSELLSPAGGHVFSPIPTIFKLVRDINKTNALTNFHDYWPKIVTFRGKLPLIHKEKNAPPTGGHVFLPISIIF
ncbi:hypothetical protein DPMN_084570, partial [Dreissena polymorpha]